MATATKPPIESLLPYLREQIPGCGINDSELNELRRIYPEVSFKDIKRVYYEAINKKTMQPISYMVRRLQVLKPANDPFRLNPQARYNGKIRVEVGTDWNAKNAEICESYRRGRCVYAHNFLEDEKFKRYITNAQIGDATNEDFLSSLGVGNFDVCIVGHCS